MAAPTLSDYQQSTWTGTSGASEVTATVTWSAGDLIIVVGATENETETLNLPTATGLTFSAVQASAGTEDTCNIYVWKATAAGSGSGAITSTIGGGTVARGIAAFVYSGSDGTGATGSIDKSAAKVVSLIRASDNSAALVVMGDWNAVGDVTVTASPASGGTQRVAANVPGAADFFVFSWTDQGAAGTTSYGIASHTGTVQMTGIALEIKGAAGGHPAVKRMGGVGFAHSLGQGKW